MSVKVPTVPTWVKYLLAALLLLVVVKIARADSTSLQIRQLNALVRDGAVPDSPAYGMVVSGWDGTSQQFLSVTAAGYVEVAVGGGGSFGVAADDDSAFTHGTGDITPAGFIFDDVLSNDPEENDVALGRMDSKRAVVSRIEGETRGLSADVLTAGADDTVNTTNGLFTYSALLGYESVGGVWDRLKMDTSGYLYTTLATALDSSIDSVSIAVNDVIPQLDSTDRMAVSIYGFNAAAGDTQPTVTTTQADNLAGTLDTLNVTSFLMGYDGTTFDLYDNVDAGAMVSEICDSGSGSTLCADVQTAGADTVANTENELTTAAFGYVFDATGWDRLLAVATNADNLAGAAASASGNIGAVNFPVALDAAGTWDRQKVSHITGFFSIVDAACTNFTATTTAGGVCGTANHGTVGSFYYVQTTARVHVGSQADATTPGATVNDFPMESPGIYPWTPSTTSTDTLCGITDAGTAVVSVCEVTFP